MKRDIEAELIKWKLSSSRLPLIIRGARQVGKSYSIEKFGRENFESLLVVNFEYEPELSACFESLNPHEIVAKLELFKETKIEDGKTLLFFDEIQECPKALLALRYFKEKRPLLHVISAGSLLEFALKEDLFSFPVGRVQFLYMKPLSFYEFLLNFGHKKLLDYLEDISLENKVDPSIHERLLKLVRQYMLLGGMPAVLNKYLETNSFHEAGLLQTALLESYRRDFGKYASKAQFKYLQAFFEKAPHLVGKHFKFSKVDPDARSRDLKIALEQLQWTGLIQQVFATSANGVPLRAEINEKKFKLVFLDIGLMQRANKIDLETILQKDITMVNEGALAEQFVGQELLTTINPHESPSLFFWEREQPSSTAEVDYVVEVNSQVIPLEVKATVNGHLRSLKKFLEEKNRSLGVKISQNPLEKGKDILQVPFYLVARFPKLIS